MDRIVPYQILLLVCRLYRQVQVFWSREVHVVGTSLMMVLNCLKSNETNFSLALCYRSIDPQRSPCNSVLYGGNRHIHNTVDNPKGRNRHFRQCNVSPKGVRTWVLEGNYQSSALGGPSPT